MKLNEIELTPIPRERRLNLIGINLHQMVGIFLGTACVEELLPDLGPNAW